MKRTTQIIAILVWFSHFVPENSFAQTVLTGSVKAQKTLEAIQGVSLQIKNEKDSIILQSTSDAAGKFSMSLKNDQKHTYTLVANFIGYSTKMVKLSLGPETKQLGPYSILLEEGSISLDAIDVVSKALVVLKGDTTEFDANAFKTEPYADSDALIKQLPGVMVDEEGNLIAQGEQVTKILVDNKEFFTTDPRQAMKNLPADIIDKIQIIDEKSEQAQFSGFDDGQRSKVINIVTKRDKRNGFFGKLNTGLGNVERYAAGGNISMFSPEQRITVSGVANNVNQQNFSMGEMGISLPTGGRGRSSGRGGGGMRGASMGRGGGGGGQPGNTNTRTFSTNYNRSFFDDDLAFSADYSFNRTNSLVHSFTNRETLIGNNANQISMEENENDRLNQSHRMEMRVKWDIDSIQQISVSPSFRVQDMASLSSSSSNTFLTNKDPQNQSNRNQNSDNRNFNFSGDLDYRLRLNKTGRTVSASVSASLNSSKGVAKTYSLNEYFLNQAINRRDTTDLLNNTNSIGNGFNTRIAYTEPLSEKQRIQVNYSLRNNSNFSDRESLNWLAETGQYEELNRQLSNTFNNDYLHHSTGLSYQLNQEKFNFDLGLDFQQSKNQNHRTFPEESLMARSFVSYLPNASLSYRPSRDINTQFQYNTSTNAPSIDQLQDVLDNQNPLNIRAGNPDLKQEYQHRFSLSFNKVNRDVGSNLNASLSANFSDNRVVNSTFIAAEDTVLAPGVILGKGGQFTRPINLDGYYSINSNLSWGSPIDALKINLNLRTGLFLNHNIGFINLQKTVSDSFGINQSVGFNSKFSEKLVFGMNYNFNYSVSNSSLVENTAYAYRNQNVSTEFTYIFWKGIRLNTTFNYHNNTGLTQGYNENFMLWNAAIGKKMFKRQQGEISLGVVDILNKNIDVNRSVSEMYITDVSSNTLQQFFMLNFTYNLRHFGAGMGGMGRGNMRRGG